MQVYGSRSISSLFHSSAGALAKQRRKDVREAYAIKYGLEKNPDLVKGHKVSVFSDHQSLKGAKDAAQNKVQRWAWFLSQFDLSIHHIQENSTQLQAGCQGAVKE
eukprot:GHVN01027039.1.p1 GENE.GHVN01027039.1~~GHVN01027039.1.p1  ORF type:complete len:105 (+),score=8.15 GHVN01027039.1:2273-2587(+)